ncbi:MAG: NADP-dependent malic enzyme [Rikenellaceae bacterium]|nr:NADP-dependent malic enzyme [Rikenellaceae bacterium]
MEEIKSKRDEALEYHSSGRAGKIEVVLTKPYNTQKDLSLAYSPGVAEPCLEIEKDPDNAYKYTAKGNLVAVISNGTAVLGLGDIGALAGKPVMEGKGLLFKTFADIDVFDIEVDTKNVDNFIQTVKNISPTFGGINLEDIKAPECFEIEERLREELDIPVMHDDQHGTAIISSAALLNALEIAGKDISEVKVVVNGAGAASIACSKLYISLGVRKENLVMYDSKGVITRDRNDLNPMKQIFATDRNIRTLADAIKGADVFLGLSVANILSQDMVRSMADNPIVFALANPDPEISYDDAMASRKDIIFATGRSDYPNQVNNVLGFPYIFRGALDVRATKINEEMKIAAVKALAKLAKEPVPDIVLTAYNGANISFGRDYLIPKALDPRLITEISAAVAKAAIDSGVARKEIIDWESYRFELQKRMGRDNKLLRAIRNKARSCPAKRLVFAYAENINTLKAASDILHDKIAFPILIGNKERISAIIKENNLEIDKSHIIDHTSDSESQRRREYADVLYSKLNRKGLSREDCLKNLSKNNWFSLMMVYCGDADSVILNYSRRYTTALEPARKIFQSINRSTLAAMVIVMTKNGPMFFVDMAVNTNPGVAELVDITILATKTIRKLGIEPVTAMLSYSNFGTDTERDATTVAQAVKIIHDRYPQLVVDGEMKVDFALDKTARMEKFPFSKLRDREVNTFIFPNLSAANISYKLVEEIGGNEVTGPILLGLNGAPGVHIISESASVMSIVNLATLSVLDVCDAGDRCNVEEINY